MTSLTINGQTGHDFTTVDIASGDTVPVDGLFFNGDGNTPNDGRVPPEDSLIIDAGAFGSVIHNHTNGTDGNIDLDGADLITYTGLESVDLTGSTIVDLILNLPATSDNAELSDQGAFLRFESTDVVPTFERTDFVTPSSTLTINGFDGDDVISTGSALVDLSVLSIFGLGGSDTVNIAHSTSLATDNSVVVAVDTVNITAPLTTSGTGSVAIAADVNIDVSADVTATSGIITLVANSGGAASGTFAGVLIDGATVSTTDGAITVTGQGGDTGAGNHGVHLVAGTAFTSTSGTVTVTGIAGNGGDALNMADGTQIDAGSGAIGVIGIGDVVLAALATTTSVTVDSTTGSILDGGDSAKEITAATAVLTAATNIGIGANALETQVSNLEATAATGGIWIDNMNALTIGGIGATTGLSAAGNVSVTNDLDITITELIQSTSGTVTLNSTAGSVLDDNNTAVDINSGSVVVLAGNSVGSSADPIETQANDLEGAATSGDFYIDNTGALTIGGPGATTGISAGGTLVVTSDTSLTVAEDVTGTSSVTLQVDDLTSAGQNIDVSGPAAISSSGDVNINAGDNITLAPGSSATSGATLSLNGDFNDNDAGGTLINVGGTITSANTGTISGSTGDDQIVIDDNAGTTNDRGYGGSDR